MNDGKVMVGVKEFSSIIGMSEKLVRVFVHIDGFPAMNSGVKILIHREAAKEWLAEYCRNTKLSAA